MKPRIPSLEQLNTPGTEKGYTVAKRVLARETIKLDNITGRSPKEEELLQSIHGESFNDKEIKLEIDDLANAHVLDLWLERKSGHGVAPVIVGFSPPMVSRAYHAAITQLDRRIIADLLCSQLQDIFLKRKNELRYDYSVSDYMSVERKKISKSLEQLRKSMHLLREVYVRLLCGSSWSAT